MAPSPASDPFLTLAALALPIDRSVTAEAVHSLMSSRGGRSYPVDTVYKSMRRMVGSGLLSWQNGRFAMADPTQARSSRP